MNRPSGRRLAIAGVATALALGVAAGVPLLGWREPAAWAPLVLASTVALGELGVVHLPVRGQRWSLSCTDAVVVAVLVLAPGGWAVVALAAGVLVAQLARRQPILKLAYNVAQVAAAMLAAVPVTLLVRGHGQDMLAAVAGIAIFWVVNFALVTVAITLSGGGRGSGGVLSAAGLSVLHLAGNTSVGLLAGWLLERAPLGLPALLLPVGLLWWAYQQQTWRAAEAALLTELARNHGQGAGSSADACARAVLGALAPLLPGAQVEVVLLAADGPLRYRWESATESVAHSYAGAESLDDPIVLQALAGPGMVSGRAGPMGWCAVLLGPVVDPAGVLVASRALAAGRFNPSEHTLIRLVANQAQSWFVASGSVLARSVAENAVAAAGEAARALGDLGARTVPSLARLREAASRLARLTHLPAGGTGADVALIIEELRTVESAVASLLGAVALAAETDLRTPAAPSDEGSEGAARTTGPDGLLAGWSLGAQHPSSAGVAWATTGSISGVATSGGSSW